jgi:hypothetical protein
MRACDAPLPLHSCHENLRESIPMPNEVELLFFSETRRHRPDFIPTINLSPFHFQLCLSKCTFSTTKIYSSIFDQIELDGHLLKEWTKVVVDDLIAK